MSITSSTRSAPMFLILGLAVSGYMTERVAAADAGRVPDARNQFLPDCLRVGGIQNFSRKTWADPKFAWLLLLATSFCSHSPHTRIFGHRFLLFDVGGVVGIVVMASMLISPPSRTPTRSTTLSACQSSEVRGQKSEVRDRKSEIRDRRSEARCWTLFRSFLSYRLA